MRVSDKFSYREVAKRGKSMSQKFYDWEFFEEDLMVIILVKQKRRIYSSGGE
jgi:hypothetical protein